MFLLLLLLLLFCAANETGFLIFSLGRQLRWREQTLVAVSGEDMVDTRALGANIVVVVLSLIHCVSDVLEVKMLQWLNGVDWVWVFGKKTRHNKTMSKYNVQK